MLSNTLWKRHDAAFIMSMLKTNPPHGVLGDCRTRTQRCWWLHSVHLGDLHFLEHCGNAVRMPLWCDGGLIYSLWYTFIVLTVGTVHFVCVLKYYINKILKNVVCLYSFHKSSKFLVWKKTKGNVTFSSAFHDPSCKDCKQSNSIQKHALRLI